MLYTVVPCWLSILNIADVHVNPKLPIYIKEARLMERKVCFLLCQQPEEKANSCPKANSLPTSPTYIQQARAFIGRGRGLHAETAQSALTVILKWSPVVEMISSILLIVIKVQLIFSSRVSFFPFP